MAKISFVVDAKPLHYYQAELLLFSLRHFGKHPQEDILIHCVNGIAETFIDWLNKEGYNFKIIEPFLDKKYCNKLRQLESFEDSSGITDGVFLLDTDTFILEPLSIRNRYLFSAKNVDAPNPPTHIIKNIFNAAGVPLPVLVKTDFEVREGQTPGTNFNGGFYFIPSGYIKEISLSWKKWAQWLLERAHIFETPRNANHIDQVSMALSLAELKISTDNLPANYNCPIHREFELRSLNTDSPVFMLHYHQELTNFGTISPNKISNKLILSAITKANKAIAKEGKYNFYEQFRKSSLRKIEETANTIKLKNAIIELKQKLGKQIRIIFHAGTPKTGTSSLQMFLFENRTWLKEYGVLYPDNTVASSTGTKHQWLVGALLNNDLKKLIENIENAFSQASDKTYTVIFSAEGLFNHWFDYSPEALSYLKIIAEEFDTSLWVWFREPVEFMYRFYKQNIINPRMEQFAYGLDLSFEEFCKREWVINHLDYLGFIYETEVIFGKGNVIPNNYTKDIVSDVCSKLSIKKDTTAARKENPGLSNAAIDMIRIINGLNLESTERLGKINHIRKIDHQLRTTTQRKDYTEDDEVCLKTQSAIGMSLLDSQYGIRFH